MANAVSPLAQSAVIGSDFRLKMADFATDKPSPLVLWTPFTAEATVVAGRGYDVAVRAAHIAAN